LTFEEGEVEWKKLGEVYQFSSGLSKSADQFGFGSPFLSYKAVFKNISIPSKLTELVNTSAAEQERYSIRKGDVFVTRTSESLDELGMSCAALEDYPMGTFNGFTKRLRPKELSQINPKFSAFFFRSTLFRKQIARIAVLSTRISLNDSILASIKMPLPDLEEQARIVAILDKFDTLTTSISEGLPREIALRQKQYEYYRDLLLSFPKPKEQQ
jgi:type I restriction enzyme S subunit